MYINDHGYIVKKPSLSKTELESIKKSLTVMPKLNPIMKCGGNNNKIFLYRENEEKLYLPIPFGIKTYGIPEKILLSKGTFIDIPFTKTIHDYQQNIVDTYFDAIKDKPIAGGILEVPCGRGKCLGLNTPILMFNGSIKMVQDIVIGDVIMGDDSTPRNILSLARGKEKMYKVQILNGMQEYYIVNESHILSLKYGETVIDISVSDYLKHPKLEELYGYRVPIDFKEKTLPLDPYEFGKKETTYIPHIYKCNSRENRLKLLTGLLENDIPTSETLKEDIIFLIRSLGFSYDMNNTNAMKYKIHLEPLEIDEYYGFEIDGNRRFVLGDFSVTHNTVMALNICSRLQLKTIILVHKEFLMNQWIERIHEFIPTARVGIIQAQTFDIENKDIVIGMIQTIYNKQYPSGTFSSFGLTIIDEVHRIGSEEFSRTLFQIMTPYRLGISATVDRKDGLSDILFHFIGEKIYSEVRQKEEGVEVRAIQYEHSDYEYNKIVYDVRGNVQYSTMINKISDFQPRRHFLVQILSNLIEEKQENQIMVLSHKRDLLVFLQEEIQKQGFATCGFYIGGMKQVDLQETEQKEIVLATYAMAAEALDIKTLNTLVMVSPKTDIVQSVGRILRTRGTGKIIVDVVDTHDVFQNQWKKRRAFYKQSSYSVYYTKNTEYTNMEERECWKCVNDPTNPKNKKETIKPSKCLISSEAIATIF
jgi:superfamily II DNA or RNA helicase